MGIMNRRGEKHALIAVLVRSMGAALLAASIIGPIRAAAQDAQTRTDETDMDEFLDLFAPERAAESGSAEQPTQDDQTDAWQDAEPVAAAPEPELDLIPVENEEPEPVPLPVRAPPQSRQIEEIIVTAQKREQISQDVPISMSVMGETFIKEQAITNVADALLFVPNFKVVEIAGRVSPQCRGFTVAEGNPAFEAPCGLALDGVSFSRGAYFSAGLLDLQRIEVLRGPQGTTFGKNTTAGVVSLVTRDPTDDFTANVDLQHKLSGPGPRRAEIGVGGPLIPGVVNFRVVGMRELRDPYMENTYHLTNPSVSGDIGDSDRSAYRVKLAFPDIFGADLELLHEHTELFSNGFPVKLIPLNNAWASYIRQYDPNADFGENYKTSNRGNQIWTETTRNQAELNFDWGGWSLTGIGGFGELVSRQDLGNALPVPIPLGRSLRSEDSPYVTGEIRAVSPEFGGLLGLDSLFGLDLGSSSLLFGVFGQQNELRELALDVDVTYDGVIVLILAGLDVALPIGTVLDLAARRIGVNLQESFHIRFSQKVNTAAVFSQLTWNFAEKWTLDLGGRFSDESKTAHYDLSYSVPAPLFNTTGDRGFVKDKSLDSSSFQPKVSLTYRLNDDINLFAHWARAFKSGGFNAYTSTGDPERANRTNPNATTGTLTYDDETGTDWGFDVKARLFDNTMHLNLSLFRLDVTDFQVFTEVLGTEIPGTTTRLPNGYQQVVNAGEARAQGVELDMTWLATDWLTVIAALGYNDTEYLSFPLDNCRTGEEPDPDTGRCDHTGFEFLDTPELSGTLTLDTRFPLGGIWSALGDTEFLLGGTAEYTGPYFSGGYTELNEQDGRFHYRAHTGFANVSQGWSFRVTVLNLTDEYFGTRTSDPGAGTASYGPVPPRSIFAQFNWTY